MPGMGLRTVSWWTVRRAAHAQGHRREEGPCCPRGSGHLLCLPILTHEKGILIIVTF